MPARTRRLVSIGCFLSGLQLALALQWGSRLEGMIHRWLHGAGGHEVAHITGSGATREVPPPPPASWVVGAGKINRSFNFDYSLQMMHRSEIDLVASYLRPDDIYLEFGSGGSTRIFPRLVKRAYSIEHNCAWAAYLQSELDRSTADFSNLNLVCISVPRGYRNWGTISGYEHGNYVQFKEYVDRMDTFPDALFDRVFIDGRARVACALKALSRLKEDSLVFIHDFYARTAQYGGVMEYYIEVARVLAIKNKFPEMGPIEEPQGLIVLRPKPEAVGLVLGDEEINGKYGADWRAPFAPPLVSLSAYFNYYVLMSFDLSKWPRIRSVDRLLQKVWQDMFVVSVIYAAFCVLSFRIRRVKGRRKKSGKIADKFLPHIDAVPPGSVTGINWGVLGRWRSASQLGMSVSASPSSAVSAPLSGPDKPEPRFFETEAIKMAKARRKKRQVNPFES